ncbi:MAG: type II toxin-antitoxin system RelE/ParE family toxin, partial [Bacteroidota bacterium]
PKIGREFINKIFKKIELLYEHPKIGRKVPEFDNDRIRELIQGKYRIVYRIMSDELIEVLRVIHGSRLMDLE